MNRKTFLLKNSKKVKSSRIIDHKDDVPACSVCADLVANNDVTRN